MELLSSGQTITEMARRLYHRKEVFAMSFDTLTAFETIKTLMFELKALINLFDNTFATSNDADTLALGVVSMKDVFTNTASLMCYISDVLCKDMDAAIDAAFKEVRAHTTVKKPS